MPHVNHSLIQNLEVVSKNDNSLDEPFISNSMYNYLQQIKDKINNRNGEWNIYKKFTNPYEFIHTNLYRKSVCKYKPISRAYFKMIEILNTFPMSFWKQPSIRTFSLAEGPGGFIEAIIHTRILSRSQCRFTDIDKNRSNTLTDSFFGMTIEDMSNDTVPGWKKIRDFLHNYPNIILEKGIRGNGDLLEHANFLHIREKYGGTIDFVTGDGGFDFSGDFNHQEVNIVQLLFIQVLYAIILQKQGGSFVLKMFDFFHKHTVDILYLLSSLYNSVNIFKPCTSRHANSEKYIVCQGFNGNQEHWFPIIERAFLNAVEIKSANYASILNLDIPLYFYNKVEDMNSLYGQIQIDTISATLALMDSPVRKEKTEVYAKTNNQKCVVWCMKYGYEYYRQDKQRINGDHDVHGSGNHSDSSNDEFTRGIMMDI